jgi:CDP-diacylglycerol--glycerol-3-phosphate 3-phosphatidyltransferase
MKLKDLYTIPNLLSLLRLLLAIPIYYYISVQENMIAILIIAIAFIADGLDGYIARHFNQISEAGKILDPLADKVCTSAGFIALSVSQGFPVWITIIIIGRDLLIAAGSLTLIGRKKIILPSNVPGKITIFFISVLGTSYLLHLQMIQTYLLIIVVIMIFVSFFYYSKVFFENMKNENHA